MIPEKLTDPVLGDEGRLFDAGQTGWGSFKKEFGPAKSRVSILVDVIDGGVPQAQRDRYREIEAWYPGGVHKIFEAIRREVDKDEVLKKWLPLDQIPNRLRPTIVDIRTRSSPPAKCLLRYQFDPNAPEWYVVIAEDYRVEACGLAD